MSNVTSEEKFEQLEKSNYTILSVANQYFEIKKSHPSESSYNKEIENTITAIQGEISKIINKEFTIAVVGELKAGKSKFINALVGYDISHSRSKAATTYPVRIKHKKEHNKSSIKLDVSSVFWGHVKTIQNKLESEDFTTHTKLEDYKRTITYVKDGKFTESIYNQDNLEIEEVRKLLEILHDLPRVSKIILPDLDTTNITKKVIPEISLEFPNIRLNADNQEGVILIDTPGLGEGSEINKFIQDTIETEIQKASAVMVVLEKGGRGSSNETEIARIMKLASLSYVIAGKMDDYNNDDSDISIEKLLKQIITDYKCKKAFAVSQLQAIQAIQVQDYFNKHNGTLEDPHILDNFTKHPSYAVLSREYGKKDLKKIDTQKNGYKKLLTNDFKETINDLLNPTKYPFTKVTDEFKILASNVLENILPSSQSKFIGNTNILKNNIKNNLILIQDDAEKAQKTFKLVSNLKAEMDKISSDINNQIAMQINNIDQFKANLEKNTISNLDTLIAECKENISKDELKNNKLIRAEMLSTTIAIELCFKTLYEGLSDTKVDTKIHKDPVIEPEKQVIDFIFQTCAKLVTNMQDQATTETNNLKKEFSNLSQSTSKQLVKITNDYVQVLENNYKDIKLPTLTPYIAEQTSSVDKNYINDITTKNTHEKLETGEVSDFSWYDPSSWWSETDKKYRLHTVFNEDQFYKDLRIKLKNVIDRTFIHIEKNINANANKIESFQGDLNDQIEARMSELKDINTYSNDIDLANKIFKEYTEFIETIDLHQELITKF